ncbi:Fimbrial protein [Burkholderia sp. lig30]|jgi:type 1 fimbria pilin|uniref:fimbrial protein n=1 Tax=Burkholderia sp. lig30 TaxID=1192124 RepID=UPI0004612490|nr:fimbrial protein [Burkholderia sp. lig30]KDB05882.1 Fimbrial protein [Burkholderia sp. lig30]
MFSTVHRSKDTTLGRRHAVARIMPWLALAAMAAPVPAVADALYAFGQASIVIPSNAPAGTVVARTYFTPQEFCGRDTCNLTGATLYNKGSLLQSKAGPDLETNVSGLSTRILVDGTPVTTGIGGTTLRGIAEVQLFRDSRTPKDGSLNSGAFSAYFLVRYKGTLMTETTSVYLSAKAAFINGTCSVSDQTVTLPSVPQNAFTGVGSTTGETAFQLRLNNCPAGYNRIGYQLSPIDGAVAGAPGTLKLRPDSGASGIGIRITDGASGQPLPLGQSHTVTGYDSGTGGSPSIPLNASYVQTDGAINGGSVNAGVQVMLDYQ